VLIASFTGLDMRTTAPGETGKSATIKLTATSRRDLFIADMNNHCIRKLSPDGIVTTFAK
jgi:hypothetical protein